MADFTFIDFLPSFYEVESSPEGWSQFGPRIVNAGAHITLHHVVYGLLVMGVILGGALVARGRYKDDKEALIPEGKVSVRNLFETLMNTVYNMMEGMMGKKNTERYFILISGLAFFIFTSNLLGLVPGLYPPTSNFNTNFACSFLVFIVYNVAGIREHGIVNYFKHFMGPNILLAPLIFPIEIVGHLVRPLSLAIRPTANIGGDHIVLSLFSELGAKMFSAIGHLAGFEHLDLPLFLPIPFYFLGLLVSIIQATVFCLLSCIYISMATAHDH